jgi:hypothetical protein
MADMVPQEQPQEPKGDLLEQLLVVAAEKAAQREAEDALKKGFVTREQINNALTAFGEQMKGEIVDEITAKLLPQVQESVKKAASEMGGVRKGTVMTPEDERDENPVSYVIKKSREFGPEALDETDKRIIWAVTHKALTDGMDDKE